MAFREGKALVMGEGGEVEFIDLEEGRLEGGVETGTEGAVEASGTVWIGKAAVKRRGARLEMEAHEDIGLARGCGTWRTPIKCGDVIWFGDLTALRVREGVVEQNEDWEKLKGVGVLEAGLAARGEVIEVTGEEVIWAGKTVKEGRFTHARVRGGAVVVAEQESVEVCSDGSSWRAVKSDGGGMSRDCGARPGLST